MTLHATAVALWTSRGWCAVLLRGPSDSGKSDLALRLIGRGSWRLVGDDRIEVWNSGRALYCRGVDSLAGAIEARGVGILDTPRLGLARVVLIADCGRDPDRLPPEQTELISGVLTPVLAIRALEPSAPDKLRLAILGRDALSRLEP